MLSAGVYRNGKIKRDISQQELRVALKSPDALVWVDILSPEPDDWQTLESVFGFHPLAVEDAVKKEQRPKIDEYAGYLFLSLRMWVGFQGPADDVKKVSDEIDVFLGPNYLVTLHQCDCAPIVEQRERWLERPGDTPVSAALLLYMLLDTIVDTYFPAMDELDVEIDKLEVAVYESNAAPNWPDALLIKKRLLVLRQIIAPTRDLLNHLLRAEQPLIAPSTRIYFQDVYDHALRLVEQVDLHRDIMAGNMDAMMAQVNNRLNEVMKTLTSWSIVLMVNTLIAGVYGMNFKNMPELKWPYGYFIILGLMATVTGGLFWWFRRIKWI